MDLHTKIMPALKKRSHPFLFFFILAVLYHFFILQTRASEGIDHYYVRYDIKSSRNRVIDTNLLMIPSKNEFRSENFSYFLTSTLVTLVPGQAKEDIHLKAKENAVKSILESSGLKSVQTRDLDTVVSYEGAIITPIMIVENTCDPDQGTCLFTMQVMFSPISFPDQWEKQKFGYKIKQIFYDFFQLFK